MGCGIYGKGRAKGSVTEVKSAGTGEANGEEAQNWASERGAGVAPNMTGWIRM